MSELPPPPPPAHPYFGGAPLDGGSAAYAYTDGAAGFQEQQGPPYPLYESSAHAEGLSVVAADTGMLTMPEELPTQHRVHAPLRLGSQPLVLIPLCRRGDRAAIERQLQAGAFVEEADNEGNTPLHVAVEAPKNEIATVQCLLEHNANINATNYLGAAPLHYVSLRKSNHRGIANILLENGAFIDGQTLAGKTTLHFACEQQLPELVEVLCLFGANTNITDGEGNTPLHSCLCKPGGRDTVKRQIAEHLMASHAVFQAPNLEGFMPVHLACRGGHIRVVQLLLERQADVSALSSRGETSLHLASQGNYAEITQLLLQMAPQTIDAQNVEGNTPLHFCAHVGSLDSALLLLRMGADTNLKNRDSKTAFDISKMRGTDLSSTHNPELVQILKDAQKNSTCQQS